MKKNRLGVTALILAQMIISHSLCAQDTNTGDGLTEGEGLFSGKEGAFVIFNTQGEKKGDITTKTDPKEFELFKHWSEIKRGNTEEYQTFLVWLQYQEYLKEHQKTSQEP